MPDAVDLDEPRPPPGLLEVALADAASCRRGCAAARAGLAVHADRRDERREGGVDDETHTTLWRPHVGEVAHGSLGITRHPPFLPRREALVAHARHLEAGVDH